MERVSSRGGGMAVEGCGLQTTQVFAGKYVLNPGLPVPSGTKMPVDYQEVTSFHRY